MPNVKQPTLLRVTFLEIFAPDGYDVVKDTMGGDPSATVRRPSLANIHSDEIQNYVFSPRTMATSFTGIANRMRRNKRSDGHNIARDFFLWPEGDAPFGQKLFQWAASGSLIPAVVNLLSMILTTLVHIPMVITEFLPLLLKNWARAHYELSLIKEKEKKGWLYLSYLGEGLLFIGRAITSPVTNIRMIISHADNAEMPKWQKGFLTVLSALITIVVYGVLLPWAIQLVAAQIVPLLPALSSMPVWIQAVAGFFNTVFGAISPYITIVVDAIRASVVFNAIGLSPFYGTLGAMLGVVATAIATPVDIALNFVLNKFFGNKAAPSHRPDPEEEILSAGSGGGTYTALMTDPGMAKQPATKCCNDDKLDVIARYEGDAEEETPGIFGRDLESAFFGMRRHEPAPSGNLDREADPLLTTKSDPETRTMAPGVAGGGSAL